MYNYLLTYLLTYLFTNLLMHILPVLHCFQGEVLIFGLLLPSFACSVRQTFISYTDVWTFIPE